LDLSRSITSERYHFIYNALPNQEFAQVDMVKTQAWEEVVKAHSDNKLSDLINSFYFYKERPVFELYDLVNDPNELNNLAGKNEFKDIEKLHRDEIEKMMIKDHDFLPLPSHIIDYNQRNKKE
jgi:hypothetical protein